MNKVVIGAAICASFLLGGYGGYSKVKMDWDKEKLNQQNMVIAAQIKRDEALSELLSTQNNIHSAYLKGVADAQITSDDIERAIMDGTIRMSFNNPASSTAAPKRNSNAGARCELPKEIARDVLRIGKDADDTARQLKLCQQELVVQWEMCTGKKYKAP